MTLDELLDLLGHHLVALCWKTGPDGTFTTRITTPTDAATHAHTLTTSDVWFSINEVAGPTGDRPRGGADHITRLTSLWADLDVKDGAFATEADARAVIDDLSAALHTTPVAIIHSGHGLQPLWQIDDDAATINDPDRRALAQTVLARWRRLVDTIADRRGAHVDAVFDLPRILRAPGTINHKTTPGAPAWCERGNGAPLSIAEILDVLDEYGIEQMDTDPLLAEPVDTSLWAWKNDGGCAYAAKMIDNWATDSPTARHPWLLAQATRLACAHRAGCLTAADHNRAVTALTTRMQELCATGTARNVAPAEVRAALDWGTSRASLLSDTQLAKELGADKPGGHDLTHSPRLTVIDSGNDNLRRLTGSLITTPATVGSNAVLAAVDQPLQTTLTDDGNARRFVHAHGHRLRYCAARGWLEWTGTHWAIADDKAPAIDAARITANALPQDTKEKSAHRQKTLSRAGIENMVALASNDFVIRITADELDAHPLLLNTPTGTVDLRTGAQHEHRPAELHTKVTGCGADPRVPTPRWTAFLESTFDGDAEMIGFVQRILGYAACGRVTHHVLPFLHGQGANGKSVLTETLAAVLGDYAVHLPSKVLMSQRYSHDTELAALAGARVAIANEVSTDGRFDEEKVKALTGGDRITARRLYRDPFEFTPSHTLIMAGNHQPSVESGGESFWRRLRLIPFTRTVPKADRVEGLAELLVAEEGPGILAWIVDGAARALDGLDEPASVMEATRQYAAEEDSFGQFVTDCLHVSHADNGMVKAKTVDIRKAYSRWCSDAGRPEMSAQAFSRELVRRTGAKATRSHGTRFYVGIALIDTDRTDDDGRFGQ
ncbi:DNA polymerase/primase [Gordonia phage GMA4]|uniref:DNA polymerase/primase n=1 Tax=Gordonia phage GMA4 TaxID=1647471 RepID=UPI0006BD8424|nr:DNA polymerase/primase [Gordonia phage GMA4]AKJ72333.1 hypothetical protein GMA4_58 [Gordonia phage GMA4]